ncbi:MAG: hypothetical protein AAF665_17855, partial [Pseudomonadota bacterium]
GIEAAMYPFNLQVAFVRFRCFTRQHIDADAVMGRQFTHQLEGRVFAAGPASELRARVAESMRKAVGAAPSASAENHVIQCALVLAFVSAANEW